MRLPKKNRKNKRKNPVCDAQIVEQMTSFIGDIAIREAVRGATLEEKMLLATAFAEVLKMIRKAPPIDPK